VATGQSALFEIALVVVFGAPKSLGWLDFCDDFLWREFAACVQFGDLGFGFCLLRFGVIEDRRAVLGAPVWALAIELCGVV
jgi:hypothetical protein